MNSTTEIHRCQSACVLQRYFRTFAANPSDSISDMVIQMHFLSLYKGRICVYSTRTDFKHNSYTYSYTRFSALGKIYKIFKNGLSDSYRRVFKVAGGIKTVIHIVIQKSGQNKKKPQQKHFYCGFVVVPPELYFLYFI